MKTIKSPPLNQIPPNYTGKIVWADGEIWYCKDGDLHRDSGPAMIWKNGTKKWYKNDKLHRTDGPAVEWSNGLVEHYINGELTTKKAQELFNWLFPEDK